MKAVIKTGRKDSIVSSYNLMFDNGLRLKTDDLTWCAKDERNAIRAQFDQVVAVLREAGIEVESD